MITRRVLSLCAASALIGAAPPPAPQPIPAPQATQAPQATIDGAARTLKTLKARLGKSFAPLLSKAKAILVAPEGSAVNAVLLMRWDGHWSEPAFFDAAALPTAKPAVLLIMSDHGLDAVLHQRGLALDGPDGLSLAPLPGKIGAELLLWPRTARLDPGGFHQDDATNAQWYGRARSAPEIVGGTPPDVRSSGLRAILESQPAGVAPHRTPSR